MRVVILNMMILGMASCLIGEEVFAREPVVQEKFSPKNAIRGKTQLLKSEDGSLSVHTGQSRKKSKTDLRTRLSENKAKFNVRTEFETEKAKPDIETEFETEKTESDVQMKPLTEKAKPDIETEFETEKAESDVQTNMPASSVGGSVPPPPPSAMSGNVPPPPPPFAISGSVPPPPPFAGMPGLGAVQVRDVDVGVVVEGLRENLDEFLETNDVKISANIVNLYLQGNKGKISEGISAAEAAMMRLNNRLDGDLAGMDKISAENPIIREFREIFEKLQDSLKKLTVKGYRSEDADKSATFRKVSKDINKIAVEYFRKVMDSVDVLKKVPDLKSLKDAETVLERAVVLANSFSNLVDLSEQPRNEAFSERSTQDMLEIVNLKRYIAAELKRIDSATSTEKSDSNSVTLPTGDIVAEKEYLEKALQCINETLEGNNQLQKLLDMRDVLNNKYTVIKQQTVSKKDPLTIIRGLNDRIAKIGDLLGQVSKKASSKEPGDTESNGNYSQYGNMFTEVDTKYGGALIASVNQWISSDDSAQFDRSKVISAFRNKKLKGDIAAEYIRLITRDRNLCASFATNVIQKMNDCRKFKASSIVSASKKAEKKEEEDRKVLLEITLEIPDKKAEIGTSSDKKVKLSTSSGEKEVVKLGTSSDKNRQSNMISFSMLRKNCEEYVQEMLNAPKEIGEIPEILSKIRKGFSKEVGDKELSTYVNNVLNDYFVFENFPPQDDLVSIKATDKEKGFLSPSDVRNVVFALAQNCNLAVKQPALPLFPTSKDTNNMWVFKMALDLRAVISEIIKLISEMRTEISAESEQSKNGKLEESIKKLSDLNDLIRSAIGQDYVMNQVVQDLKTAISNTKNEISAEEEQIDNAKFSEISDKLQDLSKSTSAVGDRYAKNGQIDEAKLRSIIDGLQEVREVALQNKTKSNRK